MASSAIQNEICLILWLSGVVHVCTCTLCLAYLLYTYFSCVCGSYDVLNCGLKWWVS